VSDYSIPFQFRAYADIEYKRPKRERSRLPMSGRRTLVFDVETTTDRHQRLRFGHAILASDYWDGHNLTCLVLERVSFYADDLPEFRPATYAALCKFAANRGHRLISSTEFTRDYMLRCGYPDVLSPDYQPGTVTGYNLSFDIFRLGKWITEPKGEKYRNGVGCRFRDLPGEPRYRQSKSGIGMSREFTRGHNSGTAWHPPVVLDLAQLVRAMTGDPHSLKSAGTAFKCDVVKSDQPDVFDPEGHGQLGQVDYEIEYGWQDVEATFDLYQKAVSRFYRHPVDLPPEKMFSAASLDKAYMRAMRIHAPLCPCEDCAASGRGARKVPKDILGLFDSSFLGGLSSAGIARLKVPGMLWDAKSMYPAMMSHYGMWDLRIAERLVVREETSEVQEFLDRVTIDYIFENPARAFEEMRGVVEWHSDGDLIPVKGFWGVENQGQSHIAVKYVYQEPSDPPMVRPIADLVASKLRSGKTPKVLHAYRVYGEGIQSGLRPVKFADRVKFNPLTADWDTFLVNQRSAIKAEGDPYEEEQAYKQTVNSDYGISAERNLKVRDSEVWGIGHQSWHVKQAEEPGEFNCPLFACLITGGARLVLAMIQVLAGPGVFMDTDSYCIPATPDGTSDSGVSVLSYVQVGAIVGRFDALNPYDQNLVPHWLDLQVPKKGDTEQVYFTSISAKRYAAYRMRDDQPVILGTYEGTPEASEALGKADFGPGSGLDLIKVSEHGLGLYLPPLARGSVQDETEKEFKSSKKRFYEESWTWGLRKYVFGEAVADLPWLDLPAVSRFPVRTRNTWKAFKSLNTYPDGQIKPVSEQVGVPGSFYIVVFRPRMSELSEKLRLIAPHETDPDLWTELPWFDLNTGRQYWITTDVEDPDPARILVKSYRDVLHEYFTHPELKYDGPDGRPCRARTRGILQPGIVRPSGYQTVTKDGSSLNTLDESLGFKGPFRYADDTRKRLEILVREVFEVKKIGRGHLHYGAYLSGQGKIAQNFLSGKAVVIREGHWHSINNFCKTQVIGDLQETGYMRGGVWDTYDMYREYLMLVRSGLVMIEPYKPPDVDLTIDDIGTEEIIDGDEYA
jgi:hypothetical protein